MTPALLAALHAICFTTPRPWSETEFSDMLKARGVFLLTREHGFLLGRTIADQSELLTLAVHPNRRRTGIARALTAEFLTRSKELGATEVFLEVAATNHAAQALYKAMNFTLTGKRAGYYRTPEGGAVDAILFSLRLPDVP